MRNIKLVLQYDGTAYSGWQSQSQGERTIQDTLARCAGRLDGRRAVVRGSGRTDAGVHALGQVATFKTSSLQPVDTIARALNAMLPRDIRVLEATEAQPSFDPQRDALGKRYVYMAASMRTVPPFVAPYVWRVPEGLGMGAMREAAALLVGEHDFRSFMGAGSSVRSTVRNLRVLRLVQRRSLPFMGFALRAPAGARFMVFEVEGDGFLKQMVRNIVGTLVDVGIGRLRPGDVGRILACRDRTEAGVTAPAHGLFLEKVLYRAPGQ